MTYIGTSDLLSSLQTRRQSAVLSSEFNRLTQEISSGKSAKNISDSSTINSKYASLNRSISLVNSYEQNAKTLELEQNIKSEAILSMKKSITGLGVSILSTTTINPQGMDSIVGNATDLFKSLVSTINTNVAGRYVFSGQESTSPPLSSAEFIISQLEIETSGLNDPSSIISRIDQWFTQPNSGFDTLAYQGGPEKITDTPISSSSSISEGKIATSLEVREALRDLSLLSLYQKGSLSLLPDDAIQLVAHVGNNLVESEQGLLKLASEVGILQEAIKSARTQNAAEGFAFREALNALESVDLYQAVAEFEQIQNQIESLYLVTSRASQLNFTQFMR